MAPDPPRPFELAARRNRCRIPIYVEDSCTSIAEAAAGLSGSRLSR